MKIKGIKDFIKLALVITVAVSLIGCGASADTSRVEKPEIAGTQTDVETGTNQHPDGGNSDSALQVSQSEYTPYQQFLGLDPNTVISAVVDNDVSLGYDDYEKKFVGKDFTYQELIDVMQENRNMPGNSIVEASFAYIDFNGSQGLALRFDNMNIDGDGDDSYSILFLSYYEDKLHITYSIDGWSRCSSEVNSMGYVYTSGSAGAGEHIETTGFIDSDGHYVELCYKTYYSSEWIAYNVDADAYAKAYGQELPGIVVVENIIGDAKVYSYYSMDYNDYSDADNIFISAAEENGINWTSSEILAGMISVQADLHGISTDIANASMPGWNVVIDNNGVKQTVLSMNYEDWTDYWNNYPVVATESKINEKYYPQFVAIGSFDAEFEEVSEYLHSDDADTDNCIYFLKEALINHESAFQVYITSDYNTLIRLPEDGKCLMIYSTPVDFIYGTMPEICANDYDNDGEMELMIWEYLFHGTGFSQHTLFMVDTNEDGDWCAYHLTPEWYVGQMKQHYTAVNEADSIRIYLDGEEYGIIDKDGDDSPINLYGAFRVKIENEGSRFKIVSVPLYLSAKNMVGYTNGQMKLTVSYGGCGNWILEDYELVEEE